MEAYTGIGQRVMDEAALMGRLEEAARSLPQNQASSRYVFLDVAYPGNSEEAKSLAGWSLLFLCAVSQDQEELPLKRVYLRLGEKERDIAPLVESHGILPAKRKRIVETLGRFRSISLYLIPSGLTTIEAELVVDFARSRTNFVVQTFPFGGGGVPSFVDVENPPGVPLEEPTKTMAMREFPVLFGN